MRKQTPLVSILLPVHNAQEYLEESLQSLLSQTYSNIEIIAIDDFSRDHTYQLLKEYRKKDKRLVIRKNVKHYGLRLTLNRCVRHVKGQYIAFMNPSDIE